MSTSLFCQDDGEIALFRHFSQAIVSTIAFIILLPISIHFFDNIGLCNCSKCLKKCICCKIWSLLKDTDLPESPRSISTQTKSRSKLRSSASNRDRDSFHDPERRRYNLAYSSMIFICLTLLFCTAIGKWACFDDSLHPVTTVVSVFGHLLLYALLGVTINGIFMLRLKQTFADTLLKVDKKSLIIIIVMAIVSPVLAMIAIVIGYTFNGFLWLAYIFGACGAFVYCITAFLLLYMYVSRLHKVCSIHCLRKKLTTKQKFFGTMHVI